MANAGHTLLATQYECTSISLFSVTHDALTVKHFIHYAQSQELTGAAHWSRTKVNTSDIR